MIMMMIHSVTPSQPFHRTVQHPILRSAQPRPVPVTVISASLRMRPRAIKQEMDRVKEQTGQGRDGQSQCTRKTRCHGEKSLICIGSLAFQHSTTASADRSSVSCLGAHSAMLLIEMEHHRFVLEQQCIVCCGRTLLHRHLSFILTGLQCHPLRMRYCVN